MFGNMKGVMFMYKGQKSIRNGIQDFLCPFT